MNKNAVWLLAFVCTFLFSCSSNDFDAGNQKDGMVDFTISTSIPQGITTYASENGGVTNVDATEYDLRYILEVWTQEITPRLAYRAIQTVDAAFSTKVEFSARLLALKYNFVFWADFVLQGKKEEDLYYKTHNELGLRDILINSVPTYDIANDARDAFYAVEKVDLKIVNIIGDVTLTRPFGKYRLIATDTPMGELPDRPVKAVITYTGTSVKLPSGFDALTSTVNTDENIAIITGSLPHNDITPEKVFAGGEEYENAYVLAFDYIFAAPEQTVSFNVTSYSDTDGEEKIGYRKLSNIPIEANKLTTVIGNFFTNEFKYKVFVEDKFSGEDVTDNTEIHADASGNYEIIIPKSKTSFASLTYTVSEDIKVGAKITVKNAGDSKYLGSITLDIKDGLNNAIVTFDTPGATVSVLGTIGGSLIITRAAVVNVDMNTTITGNKITNSNGAKVFWTVHNGDQLQEALKYPADKNRGVNLMGNCEAEGSLYAFSIGETDKASYEGYVFNGNGHVVSGKATYELLQCYADGVIIKNVTFDATTDEVESIGASGLGFFNAENAVIENVTAIKSNHAGVIVNASTVKAINLTTYGNKWGGVNVDNKDGSVIPKFELVSGTFGEDNKIYSENEGEANTWVKFLEGSGSWTHIVSGSFISYRPIGAPVPAGAVVIGNTPYDDLNTAIGAAKSGDKIEIGAGEWTEEIIIKAGVTLQGAGSATVLKGYIQLMAGSTLKDAKIEYSKSDANTSYALQVSGSNVTIDHVEFTYTGSYNKKEAIEVSVAGNNFTLINSTINQFYKGVYINPNLFVTITNNTFNEVNPFNADGNVESLVVTGNTFNRGTASYDWRAPHIIVTDAYAASTTSADWNASLKNLINQILDRNTWYNTAEPIKSIRVQNTKGTIFDTYIYDTIE